MDNKENRDKVLANDKDIARQVPGILTDRIIAPKTQELRNEELFFRMMNE